MAQQFQTGPAENGNGLSRHFSARPTPNRSNPGCAGGPKSITVSSSHDNSSSFTEQSNGTMEAHDGLRKKPGKLSAEEKDDSIRKSKTDVDAIAKKTGYKGNNGQNCKNHVYNAMSPTLSKVSTSVRADTGTSKSLDKLAEQLKNGELHGGRGSRKLPGTKTVFYMRAGNKGRLFYRYSDKKRWAVEVIGESNKSRETEVIDNLKQNYE